MKSKGFTLIELLAVIVILAIIALIAVPIILNIIGDTKKSADQRSAELYLDAVEKAVARYNLNGEFPSSTVCSVVNAGINCTGVEGTIVVDMDGTRPTSGTITFTNNKITAVENLVVNDSTYRLVNDELVLVEPAAPVPATDASCFTYQTADVTWVTGENPTTISNLENCKTATRRFAIEVMGATGDDIPNDSMLAAICNGEVPEYNVVAIATNYPIYAYMLYEADAITGATVEDYDGAHITRYNASCGTDVVIPNTLGGKNVTSIEREAFSGNNLTSVTIPNSVTTIGNYAFDNNQLTSVTIPDNVTTIGAYAFKNSHLTSVTIGSGVTAIRAEAFMGNNLTNGIIIPNSVTTIGEGAFRNSHLASVTIGSGVTTIGKDAFLGNNLTSVTIPNNVTSIGNAAFSGNNLTSVTIGSGITTISQGAFSYNNLESITIPNTVTTIENSAFHWNELTSVTIPNSVISIGQEAFSFNSLASVTFGSGLASIGESAFVGNNLTSVTIPNSVTTIGQEAFNANELTSVTIGSGITSIGNSAFGANSHCQGSSGSERCRGYNAITEVNIDKYEGTVSIGEGAFGWAISVPGGNIVWKTNQ